MRTGILMLASLLYVAYTVTALSAADSIKREEVQYTGGGVTMKGFLAYDSSIQGRRPGVLVVHEWWGHNEYARKRALQLAQLGYVALAVDMYGDGKQASHPDDAGKFAGEVMANMESARARFQAAYDLLQKHSAADPNNIAAIGYCFGGGVVVEMARQGVPLKAAVSFHGNPAGKVPAKAGQVKAKILICHGGDDEFIAQATLDQFQEEMKKAGANAKVIIYPGAKHSFTNSEADGYGKKFNLPLAYNAAADQKSWSDMQAFLKEAFGSK